MSDVERAIARSKKAAQQKPAPSRRGKGYKPATVTSTASGATQRARSRELGEARKQIDAQLRKEANKHKFSTRADVEKRARADMAAGKVKKGELQKTIERRWTAAKGRKTKFESAQKQKRAQLNQDARDAVKKKTPDQLGVGNMTATVVFRISDDIREVVLTFPGHPSTFRADAADALADYLTADKVDLISVAQA